MIDVLCFILGMAVSTAMFVGCGFATKAAVKYYLDLGMPKDEKPAKSPAEE